MGFISKYVKKVRNAFHIPGEDVIILGLDDRNKTARIYDLYVRTGSKFTSNMESKALEGNVAQPFIWLPRLNLKDVPMFGKYLPKAKPEDPDILQVSFPINKSEGCIFKTDDKPEGIMYLFDMQTGQGAQLVRKTKEKSLFEGEPDKIIESREVAGVEFGTVTIPQQIRIERDPVIEMLLSVNPYLFGSTLDSFSVTELLRGKVEMWKTVLFATVALIIGWMFGLGM